MNIVTKQLSLLVCLFALTGELSAQCCAAGNPVSAETGGPASGHYFQVEMNYRHSLSTDYYQGESRSTMTPYFERSYSDFTSLKLTYQYKNIGISAVSGYFLSKNQVLASSGYERKVSGLGDLGLSLSYNISQLLKHRLVAIPFAGIILPTGTFDYIYEGVVVPIDIQPSAGSAKYNAGIILSRSIGPKLSVSSYNFWEYSTTITNRTKAYKYGDLFVNTLGATYNLRNGISPSFHLKSEYREKAFNDGKIQPSTGNFSLLLSPRIGFHRGNYSLNSTIDIPVYKKVNGIQLTNKYAVSASVAYSIPLGDDNSPPLFNFSKERMTVSVRGNCDMCKERIEKIAMSIKGISMAYYNLEKQELVILHTGEPDIQEMTKQLQLAGHDTQNGKAPDEAYNALHHCCKYIR